MAETAAGQTGQSQAGRAQGGAILLKDRFSVDASKPLPDLDSPSAKAYMAEDRRDIDRPVFALICNPGLPVRLGAMQALKGANFRGVIPLIDWAVAFWAPIGQCTMIIILERPLGGRAQGERDFRVNEYDLPRRVIEPLATGLQELSSIGITHRAIRPDNIFFLDRDRQKLVFGECFTSPPGYDQALLYEPVERAMALPGGRGVGSSRDDVYAFGATLVSLIIEQDPMEGISDEDQLTMKTEQGSYATITGGARIPLSLLEPLRGMLNDDVEKRWSPDDIELWLSGRKMTPQQKRRGQRAGLPFTFAGREYYGTRMLARAFSMNIQEAARAIKDEAFETWIRRGLEDTNLANAIKNMLDIAAAQSGSFMGSDDVVVTRACVLMDQEGPIRYKGFSFMLDGYGPAFAIELLRSGSAQVPAEIIMRDIPDLWYQAQETYAPDASIQQKNFSQLKIVLNNNELGFGIERCLYEANPSLPCQSPLVIQEYALEIDHLLPALDDAANRVDLKNKPMDRHIAAFIASRFRQDINPHLKALASQEEETRTVGMLSLLAFIQWKLKSDPLYGLASWLGGHLGPAINSYHSRATRREIEREIPRLVRRGSLPEMFDLIDNADRRREDQEGYEDAKAEYIAAELEIQDIQGRGEEQINKAERMGQQAAAMMSVVLTMCIILILFTVEVF